MTWAPGSTSSLKRNKIKPLPSNAFFNGLTEVFEHECRGRDVRDVHILPVLERGGVVPEGEPQARDELGLGKRAELLGGVQDLGQAAEEVGEDLVRTAAVTD